MSAFVSTFVSAFVFAFVFVLVTVYATVSFSNPNPHPNFKLDPHAAPVPNPNPSFDDIFPTPDYILVLDISEAEKNQVFVSGRLGLGFWFEISALEFV